MFFNELDTSILTQCVLITSMLSGLDKNNRIVKRPGKDITHISSKYIFDSDSVNLLSSICIALILPQIANYCWP